MANKRPSVCSGIVLFWCFLAVQGSSTPVSIPLGSVPDLLIQSALDSLNENSPTHHTYKSGNLISAQKLLEPPYVIYRLTLNLEPNCKPDESSACSREACAIDLRQHEGGVIDVQKNSIQCMYLHPQSPQDDMEQRDQEVVQEASSVQEQEPTEVVEKRVVNESVKLDHEVQTVTDDSERPFIAVRATDRNYCAGCPYELNPTLAGLAAFGEQVVQSMDDSGRSDFKHKVVSIVRVTRAVPPGSNVVQYELLLEIGESNCLRTGLSRRAECSLLANVPIKLCLVAFEERPWQRNSRKMTRNNCTDVPASENELDGSTEPRTVGDTLAVSGSRGEQSTPEVTSRLEIYDQVAEEGKLGGFGSSIDEFFHIAEPTAASGTRDDTRIPVTEESHTKIVLGTDEVQQKTVGFTDKIKEFDAFLEDFDLKIKPGGREDPVDRGDPVTEEIIRPEVVVRPSVQRNAAGSGSADPRTEPSTRTRRSLIDTPRSERRLVTKLAGKALRTLDDIDTDNRKRTILKLLDSKKELRADGTVYHINMRVVPSDCDEKNGNSEDCTSGTERSAKICKVQIHTEDERPLESAKVLQSQCYPDKPPPRRETRVRRSQLIVGGLTPKRTDDPEIISYAQMGLDKFSELSESANEPQLVEIVEATEQVVSGMLYRITVRLGESTCPKGTRENCQLRTDSEVNDYLITVLSQPWIDHGTPEVTVEPVTRNDPSRERRSAQILGGPTQISTDDPEIRAYAEKGIRKYSETSGLSSEPFLVEVIEASKQVVSGMLYRIRVRLGESTCPKGTRENCLLRTDSEVNDYLITVWSRPWIDHGTPEVTVEPVTRNDPSRERRSPQIPGAPTQISTDDPEIRAYAEKGIRKYSETSGLSSEPFLVEVIEASKQVVSGMLYRIRVRLGESTCPKGTRENCLLRTDSEVNDYLITVWSRPWIDHGTPEVTVEPVTRNDPSRERRSPQIPGAPTQISTDDPEIRAYAEKGIRKYSETSGLSSEPFLIEVIEASKQVVSGMLYRIRVRLGESTCPKGARENCLLRTESPVRDVVITVWSQPWIDKGHPDIKIEETSRSERSRREATILGSTRVSTDDEEIKGYVRRALERYSENSDAPYEPLLAEIKEAMVQTVAGKLYKIIVKLAESDCPRGTAKESCKIREDGETNECLVTVWSRPWRDNGEPEIEMKCEENGRQRRSLRGANYSLKMLKLRKNIELEESFKGFMEKFEVRYATEEERTARFRVFKDNMKVIDELRRGERGSAEYGVTMFADLTPEEFRSKYTGLKPEMREENDLPLPVAEIPDIELPVEFDWRHYKIITEVKDQGSCGSCWAFAVTGNVEGLYALKHGKLLSLSEQELVDCDVFDNGCNGGLPDNAYKAIETLGGLELETDYPYEGDNEKCHFDKGKARVAITSGLNITSNETQMAQWLVKNGPISIGINANAMQFYMGGVSHPFKFLCRPDNLDHGVLIVGYGIHKYPIFKKSMPYWIIKNSWGPRWGEQGYYRVYRGDGTCGLNTMATSAVVV